jgi:glutamate synthase (ferredoxin)
MLKSLPESVAPKMEEKDACGVGFIFRPESSHRVVSEALSALSCMEHRGACGADRESGDGAGILTAIPWKLLEQEGVHHGQNHAVGMIYFPPDHLEECRSLTEDALKNEGFKVINWRKVPINLDELGELARQTCPVIEQVILVAPSHMGNEEIERRLMVARKRLFNNLCILDSYASFYITSLSTRTIVYKAMVKSEKLGVFYPDLLNELFESNWAVFHRRFSTNTLPRWSLAQPFRSLGHNGEINTLLGNRNWMKAREPVLDQPAWQGRDELHPVLNPNGSDSESLDEAMEMIVRAGNSPEAALMQLVPEAIGTLKDGEDRQAVVDFYEYYSALIEPWDGPALLVYSDGITLGAATDRNGLRPARYSLLSDGSVILTSETGVLDIPVETVLEKGKLGPGEIICVDLKTGKVLRDAELKNQIAELRPYGEWLRKEMRQLEVQPFRYRQELSASELLILQAAVGYGKEDVDAIIAQMAQTGAEPIFSMGDDTALAVLSTKPRVLFDYFKQRFAQVTNPAIDHMREKLVMSLTVHLGKKSNLLDPGPECARVLKLATPVLNEEELKHIYECGELFEAETIPLLYDTSARNLEAALESVCHQATEAIKNGKTILVLSDRGISENLVPIPVLLAVGAVHHHLMDAGLRVSCSLVVETAQAWTVHHVACLLGYGAQAVSPYLAFEGVRHWFERNSQTELTLYKAQANYKKSLEDGLLKVMSKMGISAMSSYIGAQIFECIGLGPLVTEKCFEGTVSRIGGLEIEEVETDWLRFHNAAFPETAKLTNYGFMNHRVDGEFHGNNPQVVRALHAALKLNRSGHSDKEKHELYEEYSKLVRKRPPAALRDLLEFKSDRPAIPVSEVEPASEIVKRFCTGGMSLGALSKEAHEILAIAMNRLGGKSNSGEGGEDPNRYYPIHNVGEDGTSPDFPGLINLRNGDCAASAVRQVASARFGVTPEYLMTSKQLEIKIAQGAKPGEGGQLPGHKVSEYIAKLRRAKPGVTLISPPPHHDIYSIEDLAQLIFDLHQINPEAKVSVKLVSEIGIGTVAAGVAKANADVIQISGHDGGTGAAPLSSIKSAGLPWELGLAEVQQGLIANRLRDRVLLRADGGLRTGWDVVKAALLGADEYGFGSIALVAEGCIMARICHTNNCPVGVTSQKEHLRKRFSGNPEPVVEFFLFVAEEVRYVLAYLGYRKLSEVIGRTDLLFAKTHVHLPKAQLNLNCLLAAPHDYQYSPPDEKPHKNVAVLDDEMLADPNLISAIENHGHYAQTYAVRNTDRAVGTKLSGVLAKHYGDYGFNGSIDLTFLGTGGQSFGAFNHDKVRLTLIGDANDYVAKGMNGGEVIIKPVPEATFEAHENVIIGNTCLYGATGGALYVAGRAGERFAVRNSQAKAVVEGAGEHCCEYMTGGRVAVIGKVGENFGAGMTGGIAYVLDEEGDFVSRFNADGDKLLQRLPETGEQALLALLQEHHSATGSVRAATILNSWQHYRELFWQIVPPTEQDNPEVGCGELESAFNAA